MIEINIIPPIIVLISLFLIGYMWNGLIALISFLLACFIAIKFGLIYALVLTVVVAILSVSQKFIIRKFKNQKSR